MSQISNPNRNRKQRILSQFSAGIAGLVFFGLASAPHITHAFTQSGIGIDVIGNYIPMGHEWITRLAALELIGGDPIKNKLKDPTDPRKHWTKGLAKNLNLTSPGAQNELKRIKSHPINDTAYESAYQYVYDAILGERWVDIGGFNVAGGEVGEKIGVTDCWDVVAQEAVEVQYDHFMRRYDDRGGQGGVQAAQRSQARFIEYFVAAAMASPGTMSVWDGGASTRFNKAVDRNYFLFGRAVHLFEDSFSSEHTVRIPLDNYEQLRQVKSYLCAAGSEQHNHSKKDISSYKSGDVIWKVGSHHTIGWPSYVPSNMKNVALVAVDASQDLWAAFIRTMGTPIANRLEKAKSEAQTLVNNWMSFNEAEMLTWYDNQANRDDTYVLASGDTGKGQTIESCMKKQGVSSGSQMQQVNQFANDRLKCLYNIFPVRDSETDRALQIPYNWQWRHLLYLSTPPKGWIPHTNMAEIPKGCFQMGSNDASQTNAQPVHEVCVNGFYMDKYEITQAMLAGTASDRSYGPAAFFVSWKQADAYCKKLGKRLPTEAEWEYAARAGTTTIYYWGNDANAAYYAWYNENFEHQRPHPVGERLPNAWGLYDMSGNVLEWVSDWYEANYYSVSPKDNPQGPASNPNGVRLLRGGYWSSPAFRITSTFRFSIAPGTVDMLGFRCVMDQ